MPSSPAQEVQEMIVLAMFNLGLLMLNFFIGLRTENKAATPSMLSPGKTGSEIGQGTGTPSQ
jgi:hypothetical protein